MSKIFVTVGLPASGKSTWSETHKDELNAVVHSSDNVRAELLSDVNDQTQNDKVFRILHQRIKDDLKIGKNVIYDATNLSRKNRVHFIKNELKNIPCEKVCILFACPYELALARNFARDRQVPEEVICKMVKNFTTPTVYEGFDDVKIVYADYDGLQGFEYDIYTDIERFKQFDQKNKHHKLSLGDHLEMASKYPSNNNNIITYYASLLHDIGKFYTQTNYNYKGEYTEDCHYYNHESISAYLSLFYLRNTELSDKDILLISSLISMHMKPYVAYKNSDKAYRKDEKIFGCEYMNLLNIVHEADLYAH